MESCHPIRVGYALLIMKTIDFKSLLIGGLLASTIFFGVAGGGVPGGVPGGGFGGTPGVPLGGAGGGVPGRVDPFTGLPLGGGGTVVGPRAGQVGPVTGLPVGRGGAGLPGMGGGGMLWNPNQVWEVKSYVAIAGKPQPDWLTKGLIVQGHEPFAVDERGNIMFRRRVR